MCPACITTVALMVAETTSAGGLAALIVKKLPAQTGAKSINPTTQFEGGQNESSKSRIAR